MKKHLAEWLVCPLTGESLSLMVEKETQGEVIEGEMLTQNGRRYPVRGGIPRVFLPEFLDEGQQETGETFSAKWKRSPHFGHEEKTRAFYVNWFLERYKFRSTDELRKFLSRKKRILDAGTGLGRDCRLYAELSEAEVVGVDLSQSIEIAYQHLKDYPKVHLIQADFTHLPFPPHFFDLIACDQALHHTRNTEESFHKLVNWLAPGGDLLIYVYRKKAPLRELADDYLRNLTTEMEEEKAWELAEQLTELGKALSELKAQVSVPSIPLLGIKGGTYDLQRLIYWHLLKCYWNPSLNFEDSVITNFDWYRPRYAHRHTLEEVTQWFEEAGLEIVSLDEGESGISVRGHKQ